MVFLRKNKARSWHVSKNITSNSVDPPKLLKLHLQKIIPKTKVIPIPLQTSWANCLMFDSCAANVGSPHFPGWPEALQFQAMPDELRIGRLRRWLSGWVPLKELAEWSCQNKKWYYIIICIFLLLTILSTPPPPVRKKKHRISMKNMWRTLKGLSQQFGAPYFFSGPKNPMGKWTVPPAWPAAANLRECPTQRSLWSSWSFPLGH